MLTSLNLETCMVWFDLLVWFLSVVFETNFLFIFINRKIAKWLQLKRLWLKLTRLEWKVLIPFLVQKFFKRLEGFEDLKIKSSKNICLLQFDFCPSYISLYFLTLGHHPLGEKKVFRFTCTFCFIWILCSWIKYGKVIV